MHQRIARLKDEGKPWDEVVYRFICDTRCMSYEMLVLFVCCEYCVWLRFCADWSPWKVKQMEGKCKEVKGRVQDEVRLCSVVLGWDPCMLMVSIVGGRCTRSHSVI